MEKYGKDLKDGKRTHCIYCNKMYPTEFSNEFISTHYKIDYHLEQVCRKNLE